jgi:hypothetical protein
VRAHIRKGKENVLADLKQRQAIRELTSNTNGERN